MRSIPFVSSFANASACKRLWLSGGVLAAFLLTLVIGNQFIAADRSVTRQMLGHDFLAFYTAGSFVREGRTHELYNLDSVRDFEQATARKAGLEVGKSFGPWWNPPFYALIFEPLAALPYHVALDLWRWLSIAAVAIAIGLLTVHMARASHPWQFRHAGLVPLLILISMPFVQALSHGQNTFISLLLLTATAILWRGNKKLAAGMVAGLLFYKPQLGAVVAAAMVLDLGWPALAGLSVTGIGLLAVTLIVMPGSLGDWLHQLPANVRWMQVEHAYLWERHVTLKSFWRLLLQGREAGEASLLTTVLTYSSMLVIGGGLLLAMIRLRGRQFDSMRSMHRDRLIAATITAMPLLMPFYFDYDLLLLAVPITLYAIERISDRQTFSSTPLSMPSGYDRSIALAFGTRINDPTPAPRDVKADRWFTASWAALFAWLYFNPAFALHTHVSGTVILLTCTAVQSIRRVTRLEVIHMPMIIHRPQPTAKAA